VKLIQLVPLGDVPPYLVDFLGAHLPKTFSARCQILPPQPVPAYAFNIDRGQYSSTQILGRLAASLDPVVWKILAVTCFDLYIPVLTFVFGEAQLEGPSAVVSAHRLRQEVYGFPADQRLLQERLLKEAVHELGHTQGLMHCNDRTCVMTSSHSVEWIDLKTAGFCAACLTHSRLRPAVTIS